MKTMLIVEYDIVWCSSFNPCFHIESQTLVHEMVWRG